MGTNDCCCGRWNTAQGTRIIGIASAVLSVLACIGFTCRFVQLSVVQVEDGRHPGLTAEQTTKFTRLQLGTERLIIGSFAGTSVVSFLVAILLIFAAKKNNRYLALPFMVWTILCTAAAGMFGVTLLIAFPTLPDAHLASSPPDGATQHLILGVVMPFVFVVVMFKLYTWWLIVVFNFYNRLKYAAGDSPFDSIPMQTA